VPLAKRGSHQPCSACFNRSRHIQNVPCTIVEALGGIHGSARPSPGIEPRRGHAHSRPHLRSQKKTAQGPRRSTWPRLLSAFSLRWQEAMPPCPPHSPPAWSARQWPRRRTESSRKQPRVEQLCDISQQYQARTTTGHRRRPADTRSAHGKHGTRRQRRSAPAPPQHEATQRC
jgi:hypothetical protein